MDAAISTHTTGAGVVTALSGTLDLAAVPLVHDALRRAGTTNAGTTWFVDLDGAGAIDDTVFGLLLGAAADARATKGRLVLLSTDERVRARLHDRRIDRVIDVATSVGADRAPSGRGTVSVDDR